MVLMIVGFLLLQQKGWVDFATMKEPTTTPYPFLFDLETKSVESITYTMAGADDVVIQRAKDNEWNINFEGGSVSAGDVEQFLTSLNAIRPIMVFEEVPDVTATGLNNPLQIISITMTEGKKHIISIGNLNPIQTGYYIQIDFRKVVLINKGSMESLIAILINAQYPPTPTPTTSG